VSIILILVIVIGLVAALYDFMFYKIPNILVLLLCMLAIPYLVFFAPSGTVILTLGISFALLTIGFVCNYFGWMGAGDAKLLSAASLWIAPHHIPAMILVMALLGGFLALVFITLSPAIDTLRTKLITGTRPIMSRVPILTDYYNADFVPAYAQEKLKTPIPYGIAIALSLAYICLINIGALS
jgi:prepilin peptidase CpaA